MKSVINLGKQRKKRFVVFVHCLFNFVCITYDIRIIYVVFILVEIFTGGVRLEFIWVSSFGDTDDGVEDIV